MTKHEQSVKSIRRSNQLTTHVSGFMVRCRIVRNALMAGMMIINTLAISQGTSQKFSWPEGKSVALSLTFDDARLSQADTGTAVLDEYGVKATFFVVPAQVEERLDAWKKITANGHEIGNHTLTHPCSGNYPWAKEKALENYTIKQMKREIVEANFRIQSLLGVKPSAFAYPCGQTYVGRGRGTKSFVPLVAKLFETGRTYRDKIPNDPTFCDFAQLTGIEMDNKTFDEILPLIENAKRNSQWVVLAGHEMGNTGLQTTRVSMLRQLLEYANDPANGIWIAPVGKIAKYIQDTAADKSEGAR